MPRIVQALESLNACKALRHDTMTGVTHATFAATTRDVVCGPICAMQSEWSVIHTAKVLDRIAETRQPLRQRPRYDVAPPVSLNFAGTICNLPVALELATFTGAALHR
jgi:hypothetical protein